MGSDQGYRGVLWALLGDQDYKRDCLALPNVTSNEPCAHCAANCSSRPWYDFRGNASWIRSVVSLDGWQASRWNVCELFKVKGVTIQSVFPDWMHDKNLGTDKVPLPPRPEYFELQHE